MCTCYSNKENTHSWHLRAEVWYAYLPRARRVIGAGGVQRGARAAQRAALQRALQPHRRRVAPDRVADQQLRVAAGARENYTFNMFKS